MDKNIIKVLLNDIDNPITLKRRINNFYDDSFIICFNEEEKELKVKLESNDCWITVDKSAYKLYNERLEKL